MRSVMALALVPMLLVAACDRQSGEAPQAREGSAPQIAAPAGTPGGTSERSYAGSEVLGRINTDYRGMAAPEFAFRDPDGNEMRISDYAGRPVLVNVWATWCAPCIAEMPTLDLLAEREGDALKVLTISQDLQGADAVAPFMAEYDFAHLEPWLDPQNSYMADLEAETLPITILYDVDGAELFRVFGGMDWSGERARGLIAEALGG